MKISRTTAQYDRYDRYVLSEIEMIFSPTTDTTSDLYDKCNKNVSQNVLCSAAVMSAEAKDMTNTTI